MTIKKLEVMDASVIMLFNVFFGSLDPDKLFKHFYNFD